MRTKTNFHAVIDLREKYRPKHRGICSMEEYELIQDILELREREDMELQDIRDMVVFLYGEWSKAEREKERTEPGNMTDSTLTAAGGGECEKSACDELWDSMSAITCVIDQEKLRRGMEV